jgi:hypothetical protein
MLTISAVDKAPAKLINPASTQHKITNHGAPNSWAIGAIFLNTPDPMITLTTKKEAERNPTLGFKISIRLY